MKSSSIERKQTGQVLQDKTDNFILGLFIKERFNKSPEITHI